ncbi:MAG TPA: hypothetical protein VJ997_09485 [Longimicrobiales bacterium]|nr:hypothetical protein [Longimicrobiales bacterium]
MDVDLALLADAATIDASGKLNILGVFDRLSAGTFPVQHPHLVLILRFSAGIQAMGKHEVGILLRDPGGKEVMHIDGEMHLGAGPRALAEGVKVPHILHLDGLVFPRAGSYFFEVLVDGEHHVSVPLTVHALGGADA